MALHGDRPGQAAPKVCAKWQHAEAGHCFLHLCPVRMTEETQAHWARCLESLASSSRVWPGEEPGVRAGMCGDLTGVLTGGSTLSAPVSMHGLGTLGTLCTLCVLTCLIPTYQTKSSRGEPANQTQDRHSADAAPLPSQGSALRESQVCGGRVPGPHAHSLNIPGSLVPINQLSFNT